MPNSRLCPEQVLEKLSKSLPILAQIDLVSYALELTITSGMCAVLYILPAQQHYLAQQFCPKHETAGMRSAFAAGAALPNIEKHRGA